MRVLIVYASWFGHNREVARIIADRLSPYASHVVCAPVTSVTASDTIGCDLLVLGSFTHAHHASWRMRHLVETIPERRLRRIAIAVFGTQTIDERPSGIDDLVSALAERGVRLVVPPLRVILSAPDFVPWSKITSAERAKIDAFAQALVRQLETEMISQ
ncbi:flavodoxin family protein [Roseiflexus sp.]|uniref:flavodoxin family protein n=1 Tax=Roseiflexus sp. TaxID=2562120 RepID=UPI00398A8975